MKTIKSFIQWITTKEVRQNLTFREFANPDKYFGRKGDE